jgi:hypothetical protein
LQAHKDILEETKLLDIHMMPPEEVAPEVLVVLVQTLDKLEVV